MTKNMYMALFFLFLLFVGCGFFISVIQKDETQKDIDMFLLKNKLQHAISYKGVSLSLSDLFVLKDVSVKNKKTVPFENKISRLTVHAFETQKDIPVFLRAFIKNLRFNITDLTSTLFENSGEFGQSLNDYQPVKDILNAPLLTVMLSGCDDVNVNADIHYAYFPNEKRMFLKTDTSDACLGKMSLTIELSNVYPDLQKKVLWSVKNFLIGKKVLLPLKEMKEKISVTRFSLTYNEGRLINGYKRYLDSLYLRLPGRNEDTAPSQHQIQTVASYLSFFSIHKQRNLEIARLLMRFVKNPKTVIIESKSGKSVALSTLKGDITRQFIDLLMRLDVSVAIP